MVQCASVSGTTKRRASGPRDPSPATHVAATDAGYESRMVDVGRKDVTARSATARASVLFPAGVLARVLSHGGPKGPIVEVARIAGVQAAKRTGELIPLCHPLGLDHVEVAIRPRGARALEITCTAACTARTGVEMEALTGAAIAALTIIDMTKALDHGISIGAVELIEKRGGRSGTWTRAGPFERAAKKSRDRAR
jgi:cyclic pyranopterin phosphate synthase